VPETRTRTTPYGFRRESSRKRMSSALRSIIHATKSRSRGVTLARSEANNQTHSSASRPPNQSVSEQLRGACAVPKKQGGLDELELGQNAFSQVVPQEVGARVEQG